MKKKKKIIWFSVIGVFAVIVGLSIWGNAKNNKPQYTTVKAMVGELKQTVSLTGTVKPVKELALNFPTTGKINNLAVKIGDKVQVGQLLAELDYAGLTLRKNEAEAGLQIAQANFNKLLAGASQQAVAVNQSSIDQAVSNQRMAQIELDKIRSTAAENIRQAEKTLNDLLSVSGDTPTSQEQAVSTAETNLNNTRKTAQKNIDNSRSSGLIAFNDKILAAKVALDNINTILNDDDAKYVLSVKDSSQLQKTKDSRDLALSEQQAATEAVSSARNKTDEISFSGAANKTSRFLDETSKALAYSYAMLEATITSNNFSQANLDAYKNIISSQTNQINGAITAVETANQAYHNAKLSAETSIASAEDGLNQAKVALENAKLTARNNVASIRLSNERQIANAQSQYNTASKSVEVARAQLASLVAPARSADMALAQAQISQAQASLASVQKQIDDSRLLSPIDGVITQVNYEVGEQFAGGGKALIMVLVNNNFDIEVDVTESDISKIKVNNPVEITLDAFGDDVKFHGQVYFIEPAQTVIQDVVYYKVKISFSNAQEIKEWSENKQIQIKAGMTANTTITTNYKEKVVKIPSRGIIETADGQKIVRVLKGDKLEEVKIVLGLRGDEGLVEIVSGVNEGDEIVTYIKQPAAKSE
ncbi:MAG TPA: HlyD family efflux transporter periplasmic adaptor subunit [bacterium]|nr:HlyD family efflux transporter periplasmic adaptor subunit [bacterium]